MANMFEMTSMSRNPYIPKAPPPPPPPALVSVDYFIRANTMAHRTQYYAITQRAVSPALIIRRGQAFHIRLTFKKNYYPSLESLKLIFRHTKFGQDPNTPDKMMGVVKLVLDIDAYGSKPVRVNDWIVCGVGEEQKPSKYLQLAISPSADCMIGHWQMKIRTKSHGRDFQDARQFDYLHILCNPWCEDDHCYVPTLVFKSDSSKVLSTEELEDCVLNDTGCIFMGTREQMECRPWHYAQFDGGVLDYVYSLLDKMPAKDAWRPIEIAKHLMRALERFILSDLTHLGGKWDQQKYKNVILTFPGTNSLIGRIRDLKQNEELSVSDHVLAALFTSLCRAIGIPSRCTTCYDCMQNIPQDISRRYRQREVETKYTWDPDNLLRNYVEKEGGSRWAYHVWSEIYCRRNDFLQPGEQPALRDTQYDGWQVFDHCRTEWKDKPMQSLGPASVFAIKKRRIIDPNDTNYFVRSISEPINHFVPYFGRRGHKEHLKNLYRCGSLIVTKRGHTSNPPRNVLDVCYGNAEDITNLYKEPQENSPHEIQVIDKKTGKEKDTSLDDVTFRLTLEEKDLMAMVGQDFQVTIEAENLNEESIRRVSARLVVYSVNQYGEDRAIVTVLAFWNNHKLYPSNPMSDSDKKPSDVSATIKIGWKNYKSHLRPGNHFQIVLIGSTDLPQHTIVVQDFHLQVPDINIVTPEDEGCSKGHIEAEVRQLTVGQTKSMTLEFTNPLPFDLDDWSLTLEGAGVKPQRADRPANFQPIPPGEKFQATIAVTPTRGTMGSTGTLIVTLHHPLLRGAYGSRKFSVNLLPLIHQRNVFVSDQR